MRRRLGPLLLLLAMACGSAVPPRAAAPQKTATATASAPINWRDLGCRPLGGGRSMRCNQVFRSARLESLAPPDLQQHLQHTGLLRLYDLRSPRAFAAAGPWPATMDLQRINLPLDARGDPLLRLAEPQAADWEAFYIRSLPRYAEPLRTLLEGLATGPLPAAISCTLGKDRTGIASAVVLGALGAETAVIVADYALSDAALQPHAAAFTDLAARYALSSAQLQRAWLTAHPAVIAALCGHVLQQYGSWDGYLARIGMAPRTLQALRARLLDPQPKDVP